MTDLDQHLAGCQALQHLLPGRPLAHPVDEILDHRQRDVGLEQRHAHLAQGVLDIVRAQPALAAKVPDGAGQAFAETVKHGLAGVTMAGPGLQL
jgi:hypothetical protein